jgi:hypothetical protein
MSSFSIEWLDCFLVDKHGHVCFTATDPRCEGPWLVLPAVVLFTFCQAYKQGEDQKDTTFTSKVRTRKILLLQNKVRTRKILLLQLTSICFVTGTVQVNLPLSTRMSLTPLKTMLSKPPVGHPAFLSSATSSSVLSDAPTIARSHRGTEAMKSSPSLLVKDGDCILQPSWLFIVELVNARSQNGMPCCAYKKEFLLAQMARWPSQQFGECEKLKVCAMF